MNGKCGSFRKVVKESDRGIQCNLRQPWFHANECADVKGSLIQFLESDVGQNSNVHWYCRVCGESSKKLFEQMVSIDVRLTTVEEKLESISTKLDELVQNSKEPSLSVNTDNLLVSMTPKTLATVTNESRDGDRRAPNAVFTGAVTD